MGERWIAEAEDLSPLGTPGTLQGGSAKAILHVTVSPGGKTDFTNMYHLLRNNRSEPHLLYDPVTDRLGQFFPLDVSSRALVAGSGPISTNKAGSAVIQIEFCSWPGTSSGARTGGAPSWKGGFTSIWHPGKNFQAMMRAIRSWGVPDTFPMGSTAPGCKRASYTTYHTVPGWYGHCHVPYNDHWDPGVIDQRAFFAAASGSTTITKDEFDLASLADLDKVIKNNLPGIAKAVLGSDIVPSPDGDKDNPTWAAVSYLKYTYINAQLAKTNSEQALALAKAAAAQSGLSADDIAKISAAAAAGANKALDDRIASASVTLAVEGK